MLNHQTMEKLTALRLEGMAQALEEQRRQADISQLDFEERLALLVERQWLWRENRALAARLHRAQLKSPPAWKTLTTAILADSNGRKSSNCAPPNGWPEHRNCLITGPTGSRQNLPGLRPGPPGLPRGPPRLLLLRAQTVSRTAKRPGRRQPAQAAQKAGASGPGRH